MSATAATSVASFSVVLAEVFAAVGMSSLAPNTVLMLARAASADANADALEKLLKALPGKPLKDEAIGALKDALKALKPESLDILLPQRADIHAEFTFEGKEGMTAGAAGGVAINVVSVSAGYSAMYEMKSTNKITLDVHFESVNASL